MRTRHMRWHQSAWWFRKSGCQSISTTSSALGWRRQRLNGWSRTSITRTAIGFTLQLYTSLGMRLVKVHYALRFDQSPWMELYIRMHTELRKKVASDFEKDLYKLMNNSIFGKTMENLRKRVDVKLVRSLRRTNSGASSPAQHLLGPKSSGSYPTTPRTHSVQFGQQEGSGKVERRVRRASNRRVCWPASKDVFNP